MHTHANYKHAYVQTQAVTYVHKQLLIHVSPIHVLCIRMLHIHTLTCKHKLFRMLTCNYPYTCHPYTYYIYTCYLSIYKHAYVQTQAITYVHMQLSIYVSPIHVLYIHMLFIKMLAGKHKLLRMSTCNYSYTCHPYTYYAYAC